MKFITKSCQHLPCPDFSSLAANRSTTKKIATTSTSVPSRTGNITMNSPTKSKYITWPWRYSAGSASNWESMIALTMANKLSPDSKTTTSVIVKLSLALNVGFCSHTGIISQHTGSSTPFTRSQVVQRKRPGHWLGSVFCVPFSALTLLVRQHEEHPSIKNSCVTYPQWVSSATSHHHHRHHWVLSHWAHFTVLRFIFACVLLYTVCMCRFVTRWGGPGGIEAYP